MNEVHVKSLGITWVHIAQFKSHAVIAVHSKTIYFVRSRDKPPLLIWNTLLLLLPLNGAFPRFARTAMDISAGDGSILIRSQEPSKPTEWIFHVMLDFLQSMTRKIRVHLQREM